MRVFHHGNALRSRYLGDPRVTPVDVTALVDDDLYAVSPLVDATVPRPVPRGDTVGIAAADSDGIGVSLIQSVYHAFGAGLIDPQTGILFHDRGTSFSLRPQSPNLLAARKRPAHTLMPMIVTENDELRHVLATMGGQGQPQILTQVFLRLMAGATAADAIAAPAPSWGDRCSGRRSGPSSSSRTRTGQRWRPSGHRACRSPRSRRTPRSSGKPTWSPSTRTGSSLPQPIRGRMGLASWRSTPATLSCLSDTVSPDSRPFVHRQHDRQRRDPRHGYRRG